MQSSSRSRMRTRSMTKKELMDIKISPLKTNVDRKAKRMEVLFDLTPSPPTWFAIVVFIALVLMNASKVWLMVECALASIPYPIFPWQDEVSRMPSKTNPLFLILHVVTATDVAAMTALILSGFTDKKIQISRFYSHVLFTCIVLFNIKHLGTKSEDTALIFNGIPLLIMNIVILLSLARETMLGVIGLFLFHSSSISFLGKLFLYVIVLPFGIIIYYSDVIYFLALMSAPAFETGYRLSLMF